ncbi:chromosome partitioning protein ParB [Bifidobacterium lemurum]|uniref:Chromosome partitioning protein ParB n=1 Tax=Bifidobacterium lemurum TaxID=1603886 RepID=A0A261FLQ2_9BIFI|nr:ParB/RepB/Spo0J family partition protein [Bifidobacterium lemurum]OZG59756.1 chromosome partitioning protein ParB [Bifidobacterium lemurum]QOL35047.1 ParB/RepB/Spo0J family partition protein [Bifidobacterium lemurum]
MTSKSRLGKGLGALFPALPGENPPNATAAPIETIKSESSVAEPVVAEPAVKKAVEQPESSAQTDSKESTSVKAARSKRAAMPALDEMAHPSDLFFGTTAASSTAAADGETESSASKSGAKSTKRSTKKASAANEKPSVSDVSRETSTQDAAEKDASEPELKPVEGGYLAELRLTDIGPNAHQPRTVFDEDDLNELAASITEVGVLQPIVVRRRPAEQVASVPESGDRETESDGNPFAGKMDSPYELIMGERRWRASQLAGLETIPAIVKTTADDDMLRDALLENLHRVALNPLEEAAAYQQMIDEFGLTQAQLSKSVSKSRPQIANTLRLLNLPVLVQKKVAAGVLSAGHARALLGLTDVEEMDKLATRIIAEGLSVRSTEEIVAMKVAAGEQPKKAKTNKNNPWAGSPIQQSLENHFDTKVAIKGTAKHGRIEIVFSSPEDMDRILALLVPGNEAAASTDSQWV